MFWHKDIVESWKISKDGNNGARSIAYRLAFAAFFAADNRGDSRDIYDIKRLVTLG